MTANESTVTVYSYRTLNDEHPEIPQPSRFKATRSAIARMGGVILEGTEQEVDADELDPHGRYRRIATGWGELA